MMSSRGPDIGQSRVRVSGFTLWIVVAEIAHAPVMRGGASGSILGFVFSEGGFGLSSSLVLVVRKTTGGLLFAVGSVALLTEEAWGVRGRLTTVLGGGPLLLLWTAGLAGAHGLVLAVGT